jgi:hypothetical protein
MHFLFMKPIVTILILLSLFVRADAQMISNVAGCGFCLPLGDGGPATAASFISPGKVAFDSYGDFYVADNGRNRIRKVDAHTGTITTVAGTGAAGYNSDAIPAATAKINNPEYIAVDEANNLYIADRNNFRLRKVEPTTGIITTIAGNGTPVYGGDGGPAASATFGGMEGIATDVAGNIFIADINGKVRKINALTGIITCYGGSTPGYSGDGGPATIAQITSICGICTDLFGNVYIVDCGKHVIRKVDASGIITTVAGNGSAVYSGDGTPATNAGMDPLDVAVDNAGYIYIADFNHYVRKVDVTGIIHSVAGHGAGGFLGDGGPATAADLSPYEVTIGHCDDNLYITDRDNRKIHKVAFTGSPQYCTCIPNVSISAIPGNVTCINSSVTFSAMVTEPGSTITYSPYADKDHYMV